MWSVVVWCRVQISGRLLKSDELPDSIKYGKLNSSVGQGNFTSK
jgi:hypothetical protein